MTHFHTTDETEKSQRKGMHLVSHSGLSHMAHTLRLSTGMSRSRVPFSSNKSPRAETHEKVPGREPHLWPAASDLTSDWTQVQGTFADRRHSGTHKYCYINEVQATSKRQRIQIDNRSPWPPLGKEL